MKKLKKKSYEIDMCSGGLLPKILTFALPLMLSSILQLLFNAADIVVVGRFAGSTALAAVGATSSLINLLTNLFIGFSVGANVLVARFYGARKEKDVSETIHSAMILSVVCGLILLVIGLFVSREILKWMGTPEDVLDQAALYMRIYFAGMPVILLYNFGSSILRAIGDTKRPLYYLLLAGVINVILNLGFVIALDMGVAGVALATVLSQVVSAALIVRCMMGMDGCCKLEKEKLHLSREKVGFIIKTGLPAGIQGTVFSLSNVLIQSSVNSFGSVAMAGNTAAANIEGFIYVSMNALHQAALSFTSQNFGAGKQERIGKVLRNCLCIVFVVGVTLGMGALLGGPKLLRIYSTEDEVIQYGMMRMSIICTSYFLCGIMDVMVGQLRGIGYAVMPMIVSILGACVFRIIWIFTIFQWSHTLQTLYISYPISWILTASVHGICYGIIRRKQKSADVS